MTFQFWGSRSKPILPLFHSATERSHSLLWPQPLQKGHSRREGWQDVAMLTLGNSNGKRWLYGIKDGTGFWTALPLFFELGSYDLQKSLPTCIIPQLCRELRIALQSNMLACIKCLGTEDEVYFPRTSHKKCDIINKLYMAPHLIEEIEIAPGKRHKTCLTISTHKCTRIFRVLLRHWGIFLLPAHLYPTSTSQGKDFSLKSLCRQKREANRFLQSIQSRSTACVICALVLSIQVRYLRAL